MNRIIITAIGMIVAIGFFSCNSSSKNGNQIEVKKIEASVLDKLENYDGDFLFGFSWTDKAGDNHLVFTIKYEFIDSDINEPGIGNNYAHLQVFHYTGSGNSTKQVQHLYYSNTEGCSEPPYVLEAGFNEKSVQISDIDNDGIAEVFFMYQMHCASEESPVPTTLVMLHKGRQYTITGTSYVAAIDEGGELNFDADFYELSGELRKQAGQIWEKNTSVAPKYTNEQVFDELVNELKTVNFFGVEPNWLARISGNGVNYTHNIGEAEEFFRFSEVNYNNGIWEIKCSQKNTVITVVIKKEECSDTMSDNIHRYSVEIRFENETRTGCGM